MSNVTRRTLNIPTIAAGTALALVSAVAVAAAETDAWFCFSVTVGQRGHLSREWLAYALQQAPRLIDEVIILALIALPGILLASIIKRWIFLRYILLAGLLYVAYLATWGFLSGTLHDCDRKGCEGCFIVFFFMILFDIVALTCFLISASVQSHYADKERLETSPAHRGTPRRVR
jgi:hypothetical protein